MASLKLVMIAAALVALLGASPTVEASTHIPSILTTSESLENIDLDNVFVTGSSLDEKAMSNIRSVVASLGTKYPIDCGGKACCDVGICTLKCPKTCSCLDKGEYCHAACKECVCTKSEPPQCQCMDITPYSYGPCTCP